MTEIPKLGGLGGEQGNTQLPVPTAKTQAPKRKMHFFTMNNHTSEEVGGLLSYFDKNAKKYRIQEETGENGTKHLQGCVMFDYEQRSTVWDKTSRGHYEKLKGTWEQAVAYCSKVETRTGNQWSKGIPKPLKLVNPDKWWQQDILKILESEPDDRKVYWYWSDAGGIGKSQFTKYLVVKHSCVFIDQGKKPDIMFVMMNQDMDEKNVVIFDIPRDQGNVVSYAAIESIKNGMIFSPKYESGQKVFNPPHVIVFANLPPQLERLSEDRWVITQIDHADNL